METLNLSQPETLDRNWFHIHVDAAWVSNDLEELLHKMGFHRDDFVPGTGDHSPEKHFTLKRPKSAAKEFKEIKKALMAYVQKNPEAMQGYIEAEALPIDEDITEKPYKDFPIPFRVQTGKILDGKFREDEIHVSMDADQSDPRLIAKLQEMGLYPVNIPKSDGRTNIVLTVQGSRKEIKSLVPGLSQFMEASGGAINGSIKEEIIVESWVSHHEEVRLPPVIQSIEYSA